VRLSLRDIPWLFVIWLSEVQQVEGIEVRVFADRAAASDLFAKIGAALSLITTTDPPRYARIRRDVQRVLVMLSSGGRYLGRLAIPGPICQE
jgi:hypothetical protein